MNWTLYVPAQNCCDIDICNTTCLMIRHLTLIGWIFIILFAVIVSIFLIHINDIIRILRGKKE